MAIINRRTATDTPEQPQVIEDPPEIETKEPKDTKKTPYLTIILALLLGIGLPFASYFLYQEFSVTNTEENNEIIKEAEAIDISDDLNRLVKIGSLYSLAKKEYEINFVSLVEAQEQNKSTATIAALEIIINKKKQEIERYKQKLIAFLLEMSAVYKKQPDSFAFQFNKAIAEAEAQESSEKARLIKSGLNILEGLPDEEGKLQDYIMNAVGNRI